MMFKVLLFTLILTFSGSAYAGDKALMGKPEIVDGDTIKISGESIRLKGIDAPEKKQECKDSEGQNYNCGIVATEALKAKIGSNSVICKGTEKGSWDRPIRTCYLNGLDLNAWMVRQGQALVYRKYSEKYVPEEEEARKAKRGIWAGEFVPPWELRRKK